MIKLKEVETEYGPGLGRVLAFSDENAGAILAAQDAGQLPKCWEKAPKNAELSGEPFIPADDVLLPETPAFIQPEA